MEPPGEENRGAQEGAPREDLSAGPSDVINTTGSGSSRAGSFSTIFDRVIGDWGSRWNRHARPKIDV
jgi:hypothetical protein